jgi:hypothetical protein
VKDLLKQVDKAIRFLDSRPLDTYEYPLRNYDDLRRYREGMLEVREMIAQAIEKELK